MYRIAVTSTDMLVSSAGLAGPFSPEIQFNQIGNCASGICAESAAEIVAFDPATPRPLVGNANDTSVDVSDIADPTHPVKNGSIDVMVAAEIAEILGAAI